MRLLKETFEFRTDTEADALKLIEEYRTNANSKGYTVTKASYTRKDKKSKGEIAIERCLRELSKNFKPQVRFDDCRDILPLPFDFGVYTDKKLTKLQFLIEFDGCRHFRKMFDDPDGTKFEKVKFHDKIKTNYCIKNNIPLLRIKDINSIDESIKKMFNDYPEKE